MSVENSPSAADEKMQTMRHSLSHVMAAAVQTLYPGVKFGIGPAIENGFYYDFELPCSLTPEDLPKIEKKMQEIIKLGLPFVKENISKDEARKLLNMVEGLRLTEMDETTECCGFGGTFSVKHKHISQAMMQQKVENALKTGAEYITSTEVSCLMNIESYIRKQKFPLKTIHFTTILASGL